MRTVIISMMCVTLAGLSCLPGTAQAQVETCQGKPVTIVGGQGTGGDDVILATGTGTVDAGAGDDTVCASSIGTYDGGTGVDSIELVDGFSDGGGATVIDFEHLDVRTAYELGFNDFEWTEVPSELSGSVDLLARPALARSRYGDVPTMGLEVPESSEFGIRIDDRSDTISLGEGLEFTFTGVQQIGLRAHRIRGFGDGGRQKWSTSGCDVVVRGGGGGDRLDGGTPRGARGCPPVRLYGQAGSDRLDGGRGVQVLIGGAGRDRAFGGPGRDRCVAEKKSGCER